jgi:hypothetical protein
MPQATEDKAGSETLRQEEPPRSNLTPGARAVIVEELGEEWLRRHSFLTDEVDEDEARTLLPWLKEVTATKGY